MTDRERIRELESALRQRIEQSEALQVASDKAIAEAQELIALKDEEIDRLRRILDETKADLEDLVYRSQLILAQVAR